MEDSRYILLADMNSFFASCHQSVDPSLRNKPVIVGGSPVSTGAGMVIAASYEAKNTGVYTTMSTFQAKKACPEAIFVTRDHQLYQAYSIKIMNFLRLIGPTEVASIDEAYIDITERVRLGFTPRQIAHYIQRTLWNKIHIACSIGVGPNRIIAKMAAGVKKPQGYVQMGTKQFCTYFHPKPLNHLYGCGMRTAEKCKKNGIETIGSLAVADPLQIKLLFGRRGEFLQKAANGISSAQVDSEREKGDKTIGRETTFSEYTTDPESIIDIAQKMIHQLTGTLKKKGKRARTISLAYKTERTGSTYTKSMTLPVATDQPEILLSIATALYQEHLWELPLRLFGVRFTNLEEPTFEQLTFSELL